ncbi:MAG: hypothetical protein AAFP97_00550 [Pseudomonadota bacterium]
MLIAYSLSAAAHARQDTPAVGLDAVYKCAQETDETKRLACFDAATKQLKSAEDSGDIVTVTREDVEEERRNSFGFATSTFSSMRNLFTGGASDSSEETGSSDNATQLANTAPSGTAPTPRRSVSNPLADLEILSASLVKTEEFGYQRTRFFLSNGQVWDQQEAGRFRVPRTSGGEQNTAEIRRGALGSYILQLNGEGKSIPVRRRR